MKKSNDKKTSQLGMPIGTASNRLRKSIIFNLLKKTNSNYCFQCGKEIESENELSIEHKEPYLDSEDPVKLFFDLDNIAFSHLVCNCKARRKPKRKEHSAGGYKRGCRCNICNSYNTKYVKKYRSKYSRSSMEERLPSKQ